MGEILVVWEKMLALLDTQLPGLYGCDADSLCDKW